MPHKFTPVAEDSDICAACGMGSSAMHEGNAVHEWKEDETLISWGEIPERKEKPDCESCSG